ncbi:SOS-response repressor and protease LexA [Clostridiaceae bacterium JG1575]|nr:SOS-response repressor and protease LexA [Clostridiaceae bacterium JG1575]
MSGKGVKQREVYQFLLTYTESKGYPPSVREICDAVDLRSTSSVQNHLQNLEKQGLIRRDPTKPRALEIPELNDRPEMIQIPVLGRISAGAPILAKENIEDHFLMPLHFVKHDHDLFILKVTGESMINAGIHDGDLAIIERADACANGEIAVVLIEEEATLKTFYKERTHIRLQPENDTMDPILVPDCRILGRLVGIYRKYR